MTKINANTDLKTKINISPKGSQIFTTIIGICLLISLVAGFVFLFINPWISIIPFILVCVFLYFGIKIWNSSNFAADLANASPTIITAEGPQLSLSTDPRILANGPALQSLEKVLNIMISRSSLPSPQGFIDMNGNPIPDSEKNAVAYVEKINSDIRNVTSGVIKQLGNQSSETFIEQSPVLTAPDP